MSKRDNPLDQYRTLLAIENRLRDLPCQGHHRDSGRAYEDLIDLVTTEREACLVRVALFTAKSRERQRPAPKEIPSAEL